jgi:hypothetical protein
MARFMTLLKIFSSSKCFLAVFMLGTLQALQRKVVLPRGFKKAPVFFFAENPLNWPIPILEDQSFLLVFDRVSAMLSHP